MPAIACTVFFVAACSEPATRAEAPPAGKGAPGAGASAGKPAPVATPRIGTVGLVREMKERGVTPGNILGVLGALFTTDTEKDVIQVRYEVTVFYRDGSQGEVTVDHNPRLQPGQQVRVTGNVIEALDR